MAKITKPTSGGARLMASGRHPVLLGLTPEQRADITEAARIDGRPVTQFLIHHGHALAKKILKKRAD